MAASQLGTITYVHSLRYFQKGIDPSGPFYDVEYQIDDWDDSDAFCNALMGVGSMVGVGMQPPEPHRHPLSPNLRCVSAVAVGRGTPDIDNDPSGPGLPGYTGGAMIRAQYRSPGFSQAVGDGIDNFFNHQLDPDKPLLWCTQEIDYGSETLILDHHNYKWQGTGDVIASGFQFDMPLNTLRLTFHRVPYLPKRKIRAYRGMINDRAFLGSPAECVRFEGASTRQAVGTTGELEQSVVMTFIERGYSWNKALLPGRLPYDVFADLPNALSSSAFDYVVDGFGNYRFFKANLAELVLL